MTRPYTYSHSFPSWTPRMPHRPTWPSPILQYRAHAVHMILFVPSTGFQSSATFPVALPGGSRTSRISGSEIIVLRYTGPIGLKHFVTGYRMPEERKCSQPFAKSGSLPVFVTRMLPPDPETLPIIVSRRRSRRDDSEYRARTVGIASGRTVAMSS